MITPGETNLSLLLSTMNPQLSEGEFVFCSTANNKTSVNPDDVLCLFREPEGTTYILKKELADQLELNYTFPASCISLKIHSSLEAVGLTAAFSTALAEKGISCNVVSGFFHDHLFVPPHQASKAMETLRKLSVKF